MTERSLSVQGIPAGLQRSRVTSSHGRCGKATFFNHAPRVSFYTLGCRLNQAETAMMAERFRVQGYTIVGHGDPADVAVIHTCSVTGHADSQCRQEIRKVRRQNPHAVVCAVGCYAQAEPEAVAAIESVDLIVGNDQKFNLAELVNGLREGEASAEPALLNRSQRAGSAEASPSRERNAVIHVSRRPAHDDLDCPMVGYYPHQTRANIKIQDGCDFRCSFCILPRIRGDARSRHIEDILAEGRELVRRGHKELVITGVNVGTYECDGSSISDVAWRLSEIAGIERLRISSIEPSTVSDELLEWMATSPKACRHLHLPLQSGDDYVLRRMKRVYTTAEYARFVERAKLLMPDLGLGTDIMVGFPGETNTHFENSRRFIADMPFSYLHVFSYSDRPKTAANFYENKCHQSVIRERAAMLHDLAEVKKRAFYDEHVGRTVEVLFEGSEVGEIQKGFTRSYVSVGVIDPRVQKNQLSSVAIDNSSVDLCYGHIVASIAE